MALGPGRSGTWLKAKPIQWHVGQEAQLERRQRPLVLPLVLGHKVSSVDRRHCRPPQLLGTGVREELGQQGAVVRGHPTPGPVVWDPGVG